MFCPKCGKQIAEGSKFCAGCGAQIGQKESAPQPQPSMPRQQPIQPQPSMPKPQGTVPQMAGLAAHEAMSQKAKNMENKNKNIMIILLVILLILLLAAGGMAIYYFMILKADPEEKVTAAEEEIVIDEEDPDEDEEALTSQEASEDAADDASGEDSIVEEAEIAGVVSETNEVVGDVILENIPKALYSYSFNSDLGNAQIVTREEGSTMPGVDSSIEAQYIKGVDDKAIYLDGSYGIWLSDVHKLGSSYTIAFWIKVNEPHDWSPYIHIGANLLDEGNRTRLWIGQKTDGTPVAPIVSSENAMVNDSYEIRPGTSSINRIEPNVWYHIVLAVDGTQTGSGNNNVVGTLYVTGQYNASGDVSKEQMNQDDLSVYLGINCWDALYQVAFDEVKIWDQTLNEQQIQELFNAYGY